jgi:hypothetical protein
MNLLSINKIILRFIFIKLTSLHAALSIYLMDYLIHTILDRSPKDQALITDLFSSVHISRLGRM